MPCAGYCNVLTPMHCLSFLYVTVAREQIFGDGEANRFYYMLNEINT